MGRPSISRVNYAGRSTFFSKVRRQTTCRSRLACTAPMLSCYSRFWSEALPFLYSCRPVARADHSAACRWRRGLSCPSRGAASKCAAGWRANEGYAAENVDRLNYLPASRPHRFDRVMHAATRHRCRRWCTERSFQRG